MLVAILLSSCSTMFTMNSIMQLNKSATSKDVQKMIDVNVKEQFSVTYLNNDYQVKIYPVKIGVSTTTSQVNNWDGGVYSTTRTSTQTVQSKNQLSSDYFFLFDRNDTVVFWGFLQEFSKNEDSFIAGIAPLIQTKYFALKNK